MSWIYVDEEFYATIEDKEDGSKAVTIISDDQDPIVNECNLANMEEAMQYLNVFAKKLLADRRESKGLAKTIQAREPLEKPNRKRSKRGAEKSTGQVKARKRLSFKNKKPAHLKLEIPMESIIVDEVQKSARETQIEDILWTIYVKTVEKQLFKTIKENCFGCVHDCPSQRDHDLCFNPSYAEVLDLYLENVVSKVDMDQVSVEFRTALNDVKPPVCGLERIKYNCMDWYHATLKNESGLIKLKNILLNK